MIKIYKGKKVSTVPDIFVSVRIRDCRIGSVFRMTDNLWDILYKLLSDQSYEAEMVPIVIYMKQEFIGEEILKQVRLRDMGITQGSCVIRFLQLKQEDLDQRKMKEDEDTMATLESLELKAAGPTADAGLRTVKFRISEDELDAENIQFIGERKCLAFRLPDNDNPEDIVQESFFDLMTEEITVLFNEISKKKGITGKTEMIESVLQELEKLKEIRYDFDDTIVRIQFPDKTILQFLFLPEERIGDVKDFVRKFLKDPHEDYDLYVMDYSGQKEILSDQSTFAELKMIPVARVYYEAKERRGMSVEQYLSDEVVLGLVPYNVAKEAALMLRGESLDRFLMTDSDRDSSMRKSTGGFLSKYVRSSHSSGRVGSSRTYNDSRSYSKHYAKKQSSFQPRSWSRGSSAGQRTGDDDDDDLEITTNSPTNVGKRTVSRFESPSQQVDSMPSPESDRRRSTE
uniref:Tether containing UBX domain for GLUT4 n=1 Tax=Lygus hesperus TaxID=30085 RepID=A0A0A9YQC0_LYGHE